MINDEVPVPAANNIIFILFLGVYSYQRRTLIKKYEMRLDYFSVTI